MFNVFNGIYMADMNEVNLPKVFLDSIFEFKSVSAENISIRLTTIIRRFYYGFDLQLHFFVA